MVSIIIPAYNSEAYIRECVDSALSQAYGDIEVVVVNDGSTDGTLAALAGYRDPRLQILTTPNGGVSRARNHGVEVSQGDYIMFLDADDALSPCAVSCLIEPDSPIAVARFYRGTSMKKFGPKNKYRFVDSEKFIEWTLYQTHHTDTSPWAKLFRRDIVERVKFEPDLRYEDLDFIYRAYELVDEIAVLDDVVYFYRDTASFINTFAPSRLDVLKVTEAIERHYSHKPDLERAACDRRLAANFNMLVLLEKNKQNDNVGIKNACWNVIKERRWVSLTNPRVRLKNKFGILASFFGRRFIEFLARRS